jgi:16S rRNA (uracil1498-N3)-methyltransferase
MPQFYLPPPWETQKPHPLPAELLHHLRVRRISEGEVIPIFDGQGQIASATLVRLGNKTGELAISAVKQDAQSEPPYGITLAQGLAGGDKMDWVIEKAVETGASRIVPLQCERSVIKLTRNSDVERAQKRLIHWRAITQAACEQCERTVLPLLESVQTIGDYLANAIADAELKGTLKLVFSTGDHPSLATTIASLSAQDVILLIGPEGGFTPEEIGLAMKAGFQAVSLGKRILRTETAGIAAISTIHAVWDR